MIVTKISGRGWRNLHDFEISPHERVNVFYGNNAQGKTNLIEALWMFTGEKSFRGSKDSELKAFQEDFAIIEAEFEAQGRQQTTRIKLKDKKEISINGVNGKKSADLSESFKAVVFSPQDLSIVSDGPSVRRKFLDVAISAVKPSYTTILNNYNRALIQRNSLLKDVAYHSELIDMFDVFEEHLSINGAKIINLRSRYVKRLFETGRDIYRGISGDKESLNICYGSGEVTDTSEIYSILKNQFKQNRAADIAQGVTGAGPHRDDILIEIGGKPAKAFASQGQKRSAALAMKLSEASILKESCGEKPVILLDDVMSELDSSRQDYILHHIDGWQVFITCCDVAPAVRLAGGKTFMINAGEVLEQRPEREI